MIKSDNGIILIDQWDEGEFEKDIQTTMLVDYDAGNDNKPVFISVEDVKDGIVIDSICIALSELQASELALALLAMVNNKG